MIVEMKDFNGNELVTGDKVITFDPHYAMLRRAEILGFTPKKVKIRFTNTTGIWTDGREKLSDPGTMLKDPGVVV